MKWGIVLFLGLIALGCAAEDIEIAEGAEEQFVLCTDPRPEICAQVNDPVCGSDGQSYMNACAACSDADVAYFTEGACA